MPSRCTRRPVKGMLTGPVTMLKWSFERDDQPREATARQLALAIRDEMADLEAAGIGVIQVDEPALREALPLRRDRRQAYLAWAVEAFRLATAGVRDETQVHTHMCYSEFGEILPAIDGLDADVTSIEAARSRMELVRDLEQAGYGREIGLGVYDIHSPRVPPPDEMATLLAEALDGGRPDPALGQPRLRPQDPRLPGGAGLPAQHGRRGPDGPRGAGLVGVVLLLHDHVDDQAGGHGQAAQGVDGIGADLDDVGVGVGEQLAQAGPPLGHAGDRLAGAASACPRASPWSP